MNLHELKLSQDIQKPGTGYRASTDWEEIVKNHGWSFLGAGIEGTVAEHPKKSYVLKIFPTKSAYHHFLQFVQSHPDNPHLPKFSRYSKVIPHTKGQMSYVRMEKLRKVSQNNLLAGYMPELTYAWLVAEKNETILNWMFHDSVTYRLKRAMKVDVDELRKELAKQSVSKLLADRDHKLWQTVGGVPDETWASTVNNLFSIWKRNKNVMNLDLHDENFMLRGRTLVIIDPFHWRAGS